MIFPLKRLSIRTFRLSLYIVFMFFTSPRRQKFKSWPQIHNVFLWRRRGADWTYPMRIGILKGRYRELITHGESRYRKYACKRLYTKSYHKLIIICLESFEYSSFLHVVILLLPAVLPSNIWNGVCFDYVYWNSRALCDKKNFFKK